MKQHTFTLTYYRGIGENPLVILIDTPNVRGVTVNTLPELEQELLSRNEFVYFVADHNDNRIRGLDTWDNPQFALNSGIDFSKFVHAIGEYIKDADNLEEERWSECATEN